MSLRALWLRYRIAEFNRAAEDRIPLWTYAIGVVGVCLIIVGIVALTV